MFFLAALWIGEFFKQKLYFLSVAAVFDANLISVHSCVHFRALDSLHCNLQSNYASRDPTWLKSVLTVSQLKLSLKINV